MPACQDCRFYASVDEQKGECFSLGFEVCGKTDSKKYPERAFRPNKGPKSKKSGAPTRFQEKLLKKLLEDGYRKSEKDVEMCEWIKADLQPGKNAERVIIIFTLLARRH